MDEDFIQELDSALSNVGTDKCWQKEIGGVVLWISPISVIGQEKVTEIISKSELGATIISESKRQTLAHAIVGIDKHDLRQYKNSSPVFTIVDRDRKSVRVSLDKYIYHKIGNWGAQFVDDVFSVYADLMETHQKENLKEVEFENAKDPRQELDEYMSKVIDLRAQLGLPPLVEAKPEEVKEASEREENEQDVLPEVTPTFDPFKKLDSEQIQSKQESLAQPVRNPSGPYNPNLGPPTRRDKPPSAQEGISARSAHFARLEAGEEPEQAAPVPRENRVRPPLPEAHPATPSVSNDVIERTSRVAGIIDPPAIDKPVINRNPRFAPPQR